MIKELWKRTSASLEKATPDTTFCSANGNQASLHLVQFIPQMGDTPPFVSLSTPGLYSFLSTTLFIFTKDPYSCIPLFSDSQSRCLFALGRLLGTDWSVLPFFFSHSISTWFAAAELTRLFAPQPTPVRRWRPGGDKCEPRRRVCAQLPAADHPLRPGSAFTRSSHNYAAL